MESLITSWDWSLLLFYSKLIKLGINTQFTINAEKLSTFSLRAITARRAKEPRSNDVIPRVPRGISVIRKIPFRLLRRSATEPKFPATKSRNAGNSWREPEGRRDDIANRSERLRGSHSDAIFEQAPRSFKRPLCFQSREHDPANERAHSNEHSDLLQSIGKRDFAIILESLYSRDQLFEFLQRTGRMKSRAPLGPTLLRNLRVDAVENHEARCVLIGCKA